MQDRVEKLGSYTRAVTQIYQSALLKLAMLEPLMYNDEVIHRLRQKAFGRESLISTLYLDCALFVVSLAFDNFDKAASIKNVLLQLSDEQLRLELRRRFANPLATWDFSKSFTPEQAANLLEQYHDQERKEREELFDKEYSSVKNLFEGLEKSDVAQRLRKLRDKVVAHKEIVFDAGTRRLVEVRELGVLVGDLGDFARSLEPMILGLELIVNIASYIMEGFKRQTSELGLEFWQENKATIDDDSEAI
jgi:hypothetical protein